MKMALIGYGRMGKAIEKSALARGHTIVTIDPHEKGASFTSISKESLAGVDVCIEFTTGATAIANAQAIAALNKPLVIGTTGWYAQMDAMKTAVKNVGCLWSGNFSIGMNVLFRVTRNAARMMNKLPEYDAAVVEMHHNQKSDSPGGSAQIIGKILLDELERKKKIVDGKFDRKPTPDELHVASVRCGTIPGTHTIIFDSPVDTIEFVHTARGREGFAFGAVLAAEFVAHKKGFFTIDDLMDSVIGK